MYETTTQKSLKSSFYFKISSEKFQLNSKFEALVKDDHKLI